MKAKRKGQTSSGSDIARAQWRVAASQSWESMAAWRAASDDWIGV